jgi:hypothetical protein
MAMDLAIERVLPSPDAEGGLTLLLPRAWDQRSIFLERHEQALAKLSTSEPTSLEVHELDASTPTTTLERALVHVTTTDRGRVLSAYVYPMWRERPQVESALSKLLDVFPVALINQPPSIAWALGVGAPISDRVIVDGDPRVRRPTSPRALDRTMRFEDAPSPTRAIAKAVSAWTGW